ncbi:hypothetical protein HOLleu_24446 [Holothuria leucospilota]|uniref:Helix-turn-helix domain-containing protein n=1 Tax=Holothuria leucospilota TaxID=206669 RepID=A0A9Q1H3J6_HOLLE|nr:hypothetical protein HOLleu_24446 [Holothuria leucospilota]
MARTLGDLKQHVNNFHYSIKFTTESSYTQMSFLHVLVKLYHGQISTSVYHKPTDTHQFLNFHSFHSLALKKSIVYRQCVRLKRICSHSEQYKREIISPTQYFLSAGYPLTFIRQAIAKASTLRRDDLLKYKVKSNSSCILFAAQFHPHISALSNNLKREFTSFRDYTHLKDLFLEPPILTFRSHPTLDSFSLPQSFPPQKQRTV